jgi:DNA processing protein
MTSAATPHAWAALSLRNLPHEALAALLRAFGTPDAVLAASRSALSAVVPAAAVDRVLQAVDPALLARVDAWLAAPGNELLAWDDSDYPATLLQLGHAPLVLYYIGRRELLNRPALAVVGSRNATPQGLDNARAFARALAEAGVTVVSGLALGIDGAAHEGALDTNASTLAVVGTGLDRVYPARHRELARAIARHGGLISEFPPGTPPLAYNFPRRNRLLSGLARGVLVVEAALSSGSLITARLAGEQGREVFAIPGSIHSPLARGCHKLIREGAKLVETAQDIIEELGMKSADAGPTGRHIASGAATASPPDTPLLVAMGEDAVDVDTLVARTGFTPHMVAVELLDLELAGTVAVMPGGRWQRRH